MQKIIMSFDDLFDHLHNEEIQSFNQHLIFLKKLQQLCVQNCCILKYDYNSKKHMKRYKRYDPLKVDHTKFHEWIEDSFNDAFTIDVIETDDEYHSGCGQCGIKYPSLNLYGHSLNSTGELNSCHFGIKTYNSFSCRCNKVRKPISSLYFEMYTNNDYSHWEHMYLKYNIIYTSVFSQTFYMDNFTMG